MLHITQDCRQRLHECIHLLWELNMLIATRSRQRFLIVLDFQENLMLGIAVTLIILCLSPVVRVPLLPRQLARPFTGLPMLCTFTFILGLYALSEHPLS